MDTRAKTAIAVLLLVAAIPAASAAPTVDGLRADAEEASNPKKCKQAPDGGGFGGQSAECSFRCDAHDMVSISVESSDEDAEVKGNADCGGAQPDCGWAKESCESSELTKSSDEEGSCYGESDEFYDSPLTVKCSAKPDTDDEDPPCPFPICPETVETPQDRSEPVHSVTIHVVDGAVTARACEDDACRTVEPTCWRTPDTDTGGCRVSF